MVGITLINTFVTSDMMKKENKSFSYYAVEYVGRDEATNPEEFPNKKLYSDYMAKYMDNPDKTYGLFSETEDFINLERKKEYIASFNKAQENGNILYKPIISFDTDWLIDNGLYDEVNEILYEDKLRIYTRKMVKDIIQNENLGNPIWTAAIHKNTEHFHIHISLAELDPIRDKEQFIQYEKYKDKNGKYRYKTIKNEGTGKYERIPLRDKNGNLIIREEFKGKWKKRTVESAKRTFVSEVFKDNKINIEIKDIVREKILLEAKRKQIFDIFDFQEDFKRLIDILPNDKRLWQYGRKNLLKDAIPLIDKMSKRVIDIYFKDEFQELTKLLEIQDEKYKKAYGEINNNYKENSISDLYKRLGNIILNEAKQYDKTQKELQKSNINERSKLRYFKSSCNSLRYSLYQIKKATRKTLDNLKNQAVYERMIAEMEKQ